MSVTRVLLAGPADAAMQAIGAMLTNEGAAVALQTDLAGGPDGTFDGLVINAGWRVLKPFMSLTPSDWDDAMDANFSGPLLLAQSFARAFIASGQPSGRIVFVTGFDAMMPLEDAAASGSTMVMLTGLARMMAVDLAEHRMTVNVIAPGWGSDGRYEDLTEAQQAHVRAGTPTGQPIAPEAVAQAARFLMSTDGASITGQVLTVDGGYTLTKSAGRSVLEP